MNIRKFFSVVALVCAGVLLVSCGGGGSSDSSSSGSGTAPANLSGKLLTSSNPSGSFKLYETAANGVGKAEYYTSDDGSGTVAASGSYQYTVEGNGVARLKIYDLRNTAFKSSATEFYINGKMVFSNDQKTGYWQYNYTVAGGDVGVSGAGEGVTITAEGEVISTAEAAGVIGTADAIINGWGANGAGSATFNIEDF